MMSPVPAAPALQGFQGGVADRVVGQPADESTSWTAVSSMAPGVLRASASAAGLIAEALAEVDDQRQAHGRRQRTEILQLGILDLERAAGHRQKRAWPA